MCLRVPVHTTREQDPSTRPTNTGSVHRTLIFRRRQHRDQIHSRPPTPAFTTVNAYSEQNGYSSRRNFCQNEIPVLTVTLITISSHENVNQFFSIAKRFLSVGSFSRAISHCFKTANIKNFIPKRNAQTLAITLVSVSGLT